MNKKEIEAGVAAFRQNINGWNDPNAASLVAEIGEAIDAVRKMQGLVLVPVEPTEAMVWAGRGAAFETVDVIYEDMIQAAQEQT